MNSLNNCGLELILNNNSNEYDLQSVYNGNGFLGIITSLQQVLLAIYDTGISSHTYTSSENIDITKNQISLNLLTQINDEVVLNPRLNVYFEMYAAPNGTSILQNIVDGSQPIAFFNSLNKSVKSFRNLDIPNLKKKQLK